METILQDLAYGARLLRKSPAFTAVVVFTLALGIGANTAIFSIVEAVLLRPLPYRDPGRLVITFDAPVHDKATKIFAPYRDFLVWREKNASYESMAAETWARGPRYLLGRGAPRSVLAIPVSLDFFAVLGVAPQMGRTFVRDDLSKGCAVVLAYNFWQNHLGGQTGILGRRLTLDDSSCTVIGVMPASFVFYPVPSEIWTLITPGSELDRNPDRSGVAVVGRLKPGVSRAGAETELRQLARDVDQGRGFGVEVEPESFDLQREFTWLAGRNLRLSVLVLFGAVSMVLLIACVNVANLLLSRSLARQRELAIRAALGSSRARLIRQLLTESLLLCISAAILGVGLAMGAVQYFRLSNPVELPPGATLSVNVPVLLFTLALAFLTTLLFGFMPAWQGSKVDAGEALKSGGRGSAGSGGKLAKGLIVAEMMFSLLLLAGAGLLIQSIVNFASAPLGFLPDRLISMRVGLPPASGDAVMTRVQSLPGVEGVGMSSEIALKGSSGLSSIGVEGRPPADPKSVVLDIEQQSVTANYFRFLGIPIESGREFAWTDGARTPEVAVVNRALARKFFPHENPLGKQIRFSGPENQWLTIVGIVGDERQSTPFREMAWTDPPIVYRPLAQHPSSAVDLTIRVVNPKAFHAAAVEREILNVAPGARLSGVEPVRQVVDRYTAYPRFRAVLMGAFAGFALILALVGLYGVLAEFVAQRTREIGIRMALGAQSKDVLRLIMAQGAVLVFAGIGAGLLAALWLGRFLRSLLYGIRAQDPVTLGAVSLLLMFTSLLAAYLPARRATKADPAESLRSE